MLFAADTEDEWAAIGKHPYNEVLLNTPVIYNWKGYTDGLEFTLNDAGTGYAVTDYTGTDTIVFIPAIYEGKPVTSIGMCAFEYCTNIESIEIPDSVTSIGYEAFYNCTNIESIEIPDSVTSIGDSAFYYCTSLESVVIPDSVTSIGYDAFAGCVSLTWVCSPCLS